MHKIQQPDNCKLLLLISFVFTFVYFGCKKNDLSHHINDSNSSQVSTTFLNAPPNTSSLVKRVIEIIKKKNERKEFITKFADNNGFAIWDKTLTYKNKIQNTSYVSANTISTDTVIIIPLVLENEQRVNGFIKVILNDSVKMNYSLASDYKNYPLNANETEYSAESFSSLIMALDKLVFGYSKFTITDSLLFRLNNNSSNFEINVTLVDSFSQGANSQQNVTAVLECTNTTVLISVPCGSNVQNIVPSGCSILIQYNNCYITGLDWGNEGNGPFPSGGGEGGGGISNGEIPHNFPCNPNTLIPNVTLNGVVPGEPLPPCTIPPNGTIGWFPISVFNVTNNINNSYPCLVNAFANITSQKLKSCLSQLYSETFVGMSTVHNLEVLSGRPLVDIDNQPVESKSRVKPSDNTTYQIALNEDFGHQYTVEYWSSIILHELVHGFIQKNNLNFSPTSQFSNAHETMLQLWVNDIKTVLKEVYPGMSDTDALCLAIIGMTDVLTDDVNQTFHYEMTQWVNQHYNMNATLLITTAQAYKNGTKGTLCN